MNKTEKLELIKEIIEGCLMLPFEVDERQAKMILLNLEQRVFNSNDENKNDL